MRRGLDTNVLVYAHMASLPGHSNVHAFLLGQLRDPDITLLVTPIVLHEFVHVTTDPRRFDPPLSVPEAISVAQLYLGRSNVECVGVDERALLKAFELMERHQLGRKRIADTLLFSTLLVNDVQHLITCNPGDFQIFEGVTLVDPTAA